MRLSELDFKMTTIMSLKCNLIKSNLRFTEHLRSYINRKNEILIFENNKFQKLN